MDVDALARRLRRAGALAASMPRGAFEAQGDAHPYYAGGCRVGRLLPGIGLVLDADGRHLGLTRRVPHVVDRTPFLRRVERALRDERGAVTSMASLQAAYAATKQLVTHVDSTAYLNGDAADSVPATWYATFDQVTPGNFTNPGGTCNRASPADAFNRLMQDPPAGKTQYLVGLSLMLTGTSTTNNGWSMMILVDVLAQSGGFDWASGTPPFSYSTPALTRYTSGVGVYGNVVCQNGSRLNFNPGTTVTVNYHNQAGGTGTTSFVTSEVQFGGGLPNDVGGTQVNSAPFLALASGDYGLQSIDTINLSAATVAGTSLGGVLLMHPHVVYEPVGDVGMTIERDAGTDYDLLCPLAVEAGGTLGYIGALYCVSGSSGVGPAAQKVSYTLDTCWG